MPSSVRRKGRQHKTCEPSFPLSDLALVPEPNEGEAETAPPAEIPVWCLVRSNLPLRLLLSLSFRAWTPRRAHDGRRGRFDSRRWRRDSPSARVERVDISSPPGCAHIFRGGNLVPVSGSFKAPHFDPLQAPKISTGHSCYRVAADPPDRKVVHPERCLDAGAWLVAPVVDSQSSFPWRLVCAHKIVGSRNFELVPSDFCNAASHLVRGRRRHFGWPDVFSTGHRRRW